MRTGVAIQTSNYVRDNVNLRNLQRMTVQIVYYLLKKLTQ